MENSVGGKLQDQRLSCGDDGGTKRAAGPPLHFKHSYFIIFCARVYICILFVSIRVLNVASIGWGPTCGGVKNKLDAHYLYPPTPEAPASAVGALSPSAHGGSALVWTREGESAARMGQTTEPKSPERQAWERFPFLSRHGGNFPLKS